MLSIDHNNIHLTRGDSATLSLEVTDSEGNPYEPKTGDKFIFTIKANKMVIPEDIQKEFNNNMELTITSAESVLFNFGEYLFDIKLVNGDVVDTFIIGKLFIEEGTHNE